MREGLRIFSNGQNLILTAQDQVFIAEQAWVDRLSLTNEWGGITTVDIRISCAQMIVEDKKDFDVSELFQVKEMIQKVAVVNQRARGRRFDFGQ